jgi:hypothetical protein
MVERRIQSGISMISATVRESKACSVISTWGVGIAWEFGKQGSETDRRGHDVRLLVYVG